MSVKLITPNGKELIINEQIVPSIAELVNKYNFKLVKNKNKQKSLNLEELTNKLNEIYDKKDDIIILKNYILEISKSKSKILDIEKAKSLVKTINEKEINLFFNKINIQLKNRFIIKSNQSV